MQNEITITIIKNGKIIPIVKLTEIKVNRFVNANCIFQGKVLIKIKNYINYYLLKFGNLKIIIPV